MDKHRETKLRVKSKWKSVFRSLWITILIVYIWKYLL